MASIYHTYEGVAAAKWLPAAILQVKKSIMETLAAKRVHVLIMDIINTASSERELTFCNKSSLSIRASARIY